MNGYTVADHPRRPLAFWNSSSIMWSRAACTNSNNWWQYEAVGNGGVTGKPWSTILSWYPVSNIHTNREWFELRWNTSPKSKPQSHLCCSCKLCANSMSLLLKAYLNLIYAMWCMVTSHYRVTFHDSNRRTPRSISAILCDDLSDASFSSEASTIRCLSARPWRCQYSGLSR